uniref:FLYWCH-type domain-containing protein n=1 Tax=Meloidogyne incognita TaxID=6306 RepID=A0A914M1E6_MELIC
MFSPSSANQHPYPQNFQYFGGHYPNNQQILPNHPNYSGDSSHSGTVQNLPENFQVNQGFHSVYNTNLLPTQQASSSSFKNIIEGTTNGNDEIIKELCKYIQNIDVNQTGKNSSQQRFRDQEKEDINSIKNACKTGKTLFLPPNFGDYWYFLKTRIYKNFKYHSCGASFKNNAYYKCKESKCVGALSYKGFKIIENKKHSCVEIGN